MCTPSFRPALIVVDFQEDFCPPHGSLAVPDGRSISTTVNALLRLPFTIKFATRDHHPADHVSFASNHASASPFTSTTTINHPSDPSRSYTTTLWPTHCVQGTAGAALVPDMDASLLHAVIDKGQRPDLEMYSAFYDPFKLSDTGLTARLRSAAVTHVFITGLAADFCVRATAEHAVDEGFETLIVEQGTRPVVPDKWPQVRAELVAKGVRMISENGPEVARVAALSS